MSSSTEATLCELCKPLPIIASKLESVRDIPYHKTLEAVEASALTGCILCTWILENLPNYAISKIRHLEYLARTGFQNFSLMYLIADTEVQRIQEQIRQQPQQIPINELDNLGMFFQAFYCNGELSLSRL
jgi:hypothetical protein